MNNLTQKFEIEQIGENNGHCNCCKNQSRTIWGAVYEEEKMVASYFIQWTHGKPLDSHPVNFDLAYGKWGEGTSRNDRCAISLIYFHNKNGPGVSIIDANDRPVAKSDLISTIMKRKDVIGTPLAKRVFAIFDDVMAQDNRLN